MKVFENRLVGENELERTLLRNALLQCLLSAVKAPAFLGAMISDPGETGVMAVEATWECGSLKCQAWFETCPRCATENSKAIGCEDSHMTFAWKTAEQAGYWDTMEEIVQWMDPEEDTDCDEDLHLEVAR
jgi:hypothetical protein